MLPKTYQVWFFLKKTWLPKSSWNPNGSNPKNDPIQQHLTNGPLGPPPDAPMPWQIPRDIVFAPGPAANDSDYLVIQPYDVSDVCLQKNKWPIPKSWCLIGTVLGR